MQVENTAAFKTDMTGYPHYERFSRIQLLHTYSPADFELWESKEHRLTSRRNLFFKYFGDNLPSRTKVLRRQYLSYLGLTDQDKEIIEDRLKDIRFIHITRDDLFEQTISLYFAICTNYWHICSQEERKKYLDIKVPFDEQMILSLYNNVVHYEINNNWSEFLKGTKFIEVNYSDVMSNRQEVFERILNFLGIKDTSIPPVSALLPMKRPESERYINKLRNLIEDQQSETAD